MRRLVRSAKAKSDIVEVLRFTKRRWGESQARDYAALIREALTSIATDPLRGKARDEVLLGLRALAIRQPGRPARPILFYRVSGSGSVEVIRLLHDAMDFTQHLR